ncbi:MAG: alkaline phosphatase D family protein, partial [Myxococcota bacterium]|nr:alkaline phosphatase D family protein [Myxococcota bacterium]
DLVMLDTRLWGRDEQAELGAQAAMEDPARTLLGFDQEAWLTEELAHATGRFTIIGQQVMMGQLQADGAALNPDQWDGYIAARARFFDAVEAAGTRNLVVLSGDIHSSWASDLARAPTDPATYDPATGAGALGVEVVTPGLTSGLEGSGLSEDLLNLVDWASFAPHVKYRESVRRGYVILDVTPERLVAAWYHFERTDIDVGTSSFSAALAAYDGQPHLVEAPEPAPPR